MSTTPCCGALSTYCDDVLCCKACYCEVEPGQGDHGYEDETPHDHITEGTRVRLTEGRSLFGIFSVEEGALGTVSLVADDHVCVLMDRHYPGLAEWDNELIWMSEDVEGDWSTLPLEVVILSIGEGV